jgi:5-methylcytosine-specific restriction endonuclease McrA
MAWQGSTRRATLGKDYFRNRAIVMRRDNRQCQLRIPGLCIGAANQCDHIGDRLDHRPENMRAACEPCHQRRSSEQGGAAAGTNRRARVASRRRPPEPHPGLRRNPT